MSENPVFVLSAGWRSGSTLLQRVICSAPSILLWGEPFEDSIPVHRLAASVATLGPRNAHERYAIMSHRLGYLPSGAVSAWVARSTMQAGASRV